MWPLLYIHGTIHVLLSQGFGAGNVKALFQAVEEDQKRRGNLTSLANGGQ